MNIIENKRHGSNELVIAKQEAEVITTGIAFQEKAILVKKNEINKIESKPFGSELTTGLHKSIIQDSKTLKRLKKHLEDKNTLIKKLQINQL